MLAEERIQICEDALKEYLSSGKSMRTIGTSYKGVSRGFLGGYFLAKGIDIYSRKSHVNDHIFDTIDTEEKAYWLGFLYADGNVKYCHTSWRIELTLQEQDLAHVQKFAGFVSCEKEPKYREKTKAYRFSFSSRRMAEALIDKGCIPNKSLVLTFPSHDIVPPELMCHFIRGYFDGDGCISLQELVHSIRKYVSLLGTKEFLEGLIKETSIGGAIVKKEKRTTSNTYTLTWHKKEGNEMLDYMYSNATIYLQRKYDKYLINSEK